MDRLVRMASILPIAAFCLSLNSSRLFDSSTSLICERRPFRISACGSVSFLSFRNFAMSPNSLSSWASNLSRIRSSLWKEVAVTAASRAFNSRSFLRKIFSISFSTFGFLSLVVSFVVRASTSINPRPAASVLSKSAWESINS
jgi:hypothetical protein